MAPLRCGCAAVTLVATLTLPACGNQISTTDVERAFPRSYKRDNPSAELRDVKCDERGQGFRCIAKLGVASDVPLSREAAAIADAALGDLMFDVVVDTDSRKLTYLPVGG